MTIQEILREKVLVEIIAERDAMISNLAQENEKLKGQVKSALEAPVPDPAGNKINKTKEV